MSFSFQLVPWPGWKTLMETGTPHSSNKNSPTSSKTLPILPPRQGSFAFPCSLAHTHPPLPHILLTWTWKSFWYFGDNLWDTSLLSSQGWPHWNKCLSGFTTTPFSTFGFCQWSAAWCGLFGTLSQVLLHTCYRFKLLWEKAIILFLISLLCSVFY